MRIRIGRGLSAAVRPRLRRIATVAALAVGVAGLPVLATAGTAAAAPAAAGTVITTGATVFGRALVVGSGPYAGFALYFITSDHGSKFGCTATTVDTPAGPFLCTGPSNERTAEWPAITTSGAPIAGPGVSSKLLGSVTRAHVGRQITYAGHPLYLFDMGPGQVSGEGWDEPSLPPWHGVWNLIAPSGQAVPWAGTLTTTKIGGRTVLAALMLTGAGWVAFPVYSYSKDTPGHNACTGACAIVWPAMLTSSSPAVSSGVSGGQVCTLSTPAGTQVSYRGMPLHLFGLEGLSLTAAGPVATGNGNGKLVAGGTFSLVAP